MEWCICFQCASCQSVWIQWIQWSFSKLKWYVAVQCVYVTTWFQMQFDVNPLTPKISLVILLTVCHTVLVMLVWRICPRWYFLYSRHLYAWYCIDIVRRNSVLVTHGSKGLMSCCLWKFYKCLFTLNCTRNRVKSRQMKFWKHTGAIYNMHSCYNFAFVLHENALIFSQ